MGSQRKWQKKSLEHCCPKGSQKNLPFTYCAPSTLLRKPSFAITARKIWIYFKNRRSTSKMKNKCRGPFKTFTTLHLVSPKSKCISWDSPFKEKIEEEEEISFKMKTWLPVSVSVRHLKPERNVSVQERQSKKKYQIVYGLSVNKYVEYGGGWWGGGVKAIWKSIVDFWKERRKCIFPHLAKMREFSVEI